MVFKRTTGVLCRKVYNERVKLPCPLCIFVFSGM
jgi:hypothetical protein